jgi:release factor glutamine methyltransferase
MNFKELEQEFINELSSVYQKEESEALLIMVLEYLTGWSRMKVLTHPDLELTALQDSELRRITSALKEGKPIQYLLAEAWFYGLKFKVDSSVLIPRPETEELVHWILADTLKTKQLRVLDVGTGSGCIAVSLKKMNPLFEVDAMDISSDAVAVAAENAASNEVGVNFIAHDIKSYESKVKYDLIVSNPPYIKENERPAMHVNVLLHEPHLALFVTDEDPLIFYRTIAEFAVSNLNTEGQLYFEINEYLSVETSEMLYAKGFKRVELRHDMQGKPRMIRCSFQ